MDAFAVVVNRYCQLLLGAVLPDHVLIEMLLYFQWLRELVRGRRRGVRLVVLEDRVADGDTLVTDIGTGVVAGGGNQLSDDILTLMAKGTPQRIIRSGTFHVTPPGYSAGMSAFTPVLNPGRFLIQMN
jgi:hypothetical protein